MHLTVVPFVAAGSQKKHIWEAVSIIVRRVRNFKAKNKGKLVLPAFNITPDSTNFLFYFFSFDFLVIHDKSKAKSISFMV